MIKGIGSGKLLKLLSFILLIGFFGLGVNSFVNAWVYVQEIGLNNGFTSYANNYINVNENINFYTIPKDSESITNNILLNNISTWGEWIAGRINGNLYLYGRDGNNYTQGFANEVRLCKKPVNNSDNSVDIGQSTRYCDEKMEYNFATYIQDNISNIKYYGFGYGTDKNQKPVLCFSSDKTLNNDEGKTNFYCTFPDTSTSLDFSIGKNSTPDSAMQTFNFGVSNISGSGDSGSGNFSGSISGSINNNLTGSYFYSNCTYQQIFDYADSNGYSDYLCYGGLDNFDLYDSKLTYNPIPKTGKTLGQILSYSNAWDTPQERFTFWNGLYIDRYNSSYNAMWESYPAVYRTWFDLYYRYGGSSLLFDSVREYCAMKSLDIDFNTTYYKGQYFKKTCDYIKNNGQYPYNGTGDSYNVVGVNWVGVGNYGSGLDNSSVSSDPTKFIQDFFNKLKENLPTRYDLGGGFLPFYIITFMCAIILFRFLSH